MSSNNIGIRPGSPLASSHVVPLYNPIQLAAISNYKLAQLTFAPPDLNSLRKTAVIKNMLEDIYSSTPTEWLQQMTRWQFFTPESLEEMTQEGLEEIFAQYAQTIEAFRPVKFVDPLDDDMGMFDEGDDLWIAEGARDLPFPPTNIPVFLQKPTEQDQKTDSDESITSTIFSQPNTTISNEAMSSTRTMSIDKPLPANPVSNNNDMKRISAFSHNKNRMSWKSDTGVVSGAISQNLANELMNLFDMDFAVDIKLNTAPKLPELSFKPRRASQHRQSQDMLTSLLPEFEKIAIKNSINRRSPMIQSVPQRSSSLRHIQEFESAKAHSLPPLPPAPFQTSTPKRKTILRLASLMTSKKPKEPVYNFNKKLPESPEASHVSTAEYKDTFSTIVSIEKKISTSTIGSLSSSCSSLSEPGEAQVAMRVQKPLPPTPEKQYRRRSSKEKRDSNVATSKGKSHQEPILDDQPKSTFIKIGLKKKQMKRSDSAKDLNNQSELKLDTNFQSHISPEVNPFDSNEPKPVKKSASFHWRIKSRSKPVEV